MCFPGILFFGTPFVVNCYPRAEGAISSRYARATTDNRSKPHTYDTDDDQGSPRDGERRPNRGPRTVQVPGVRYANLIFDQPPCSFIRCCFSPPTRVHHARRRGPSMHPPRPFFSDALDTSEMRINSRSHPALPHPSRRHTQARPARRRSSRTGSSNSRRRER